MPQLIGIIGRSGAGKSTAIQALTGSETWGTLAWSDPLKAMLASYIGALGYTRSVSRDSVHSDREGLIGPLGVSVREALQGMGEGCREHVHPDFWLKPTMREARHFIRLGYNVVIDGTRYENEALAIKSAGGKLIEIKRDTGSELQGRSAKHASERQSLPAADITLENNGTVEELQAKLLDAIR